MRIFLNILVLKEAPVDCVGNAEKQANSESAPEDEAAIRLPQPHAHLIFAAVAKRMHEQIERDEA
jgi:hypothetical protein